MKKKILYIILVSSFLIFYLGNYFFKYIFLSLIDYIPAVEHYYNYILGWDDYMANNGTSAAYTLFALILVYVKNDKSHIFETYMYVISIAIYNIFNTFSLYGSRVFIDFNIIAIMLLPQMIFDKDTKYRKLFILISIVFCIGVFFFKYWLHNMDEVNPFIFR